MIFGSGYKVLGDMVVGCLRDVSCVVSSRDVVRDLWDVSVVDFEFCSGPDVGLDEADAAHVIKVVPLVGSSDRELSLMDFIFCALSSFFALLIPLLILASSLTSDTGTDCFTDNSLSYFRLAFVKTVFIP